MNNDDFKGAVAVRVQFSSAAQSRPTLCVPVAYSMPRYFKVNSNFKSLKCIYLLYDAAYKLIVVSELIGIEKMFILQLLRSV